MLNKTNANDKRQVLVMREVNYQLHILLGDEIFHREYQMYHAGNAYANIYIMYNSPSIDGNRDEQALPTFVRKEG